MTLYKNKYRIEPARLLGYDYGCNGAYHITICTKDRLPYFGVIVETDYDPSSLKAVNPTRAVFRRMTCVYQSNQSVTGIGWRAALDGL